MDGVVLITGAASGLGKCLADTFFHKGWNVLRGNRVADRPEFQLDVTKSHEIASRFASIPQLDVLINNAGITHDHLLMQSNLEQWQSVLDVNLKGAALCSRAAYPIMKANGGGHIINIGSWAGLTGGIGQSAYAASKAGLIGLTKALAQEGGRFNIRSNIVLPGVMPTRMTQGLPLQKFAEANKLGRINDLQEVADFILHLATMRNVSGQVFQLDSRIASWT